MTGHPVRDRLLARARAAERARGQGKSSRRAARTGGVRGAKASPERLAGENEAHAPSAHRPSENEAHSLDHGAHALLDHGDPPGEAAGGASSPCAGDEPSAPAPLPADDLDRIGERRGPEPEARPEAQLSPYARLLFVTLLGVTAIAALFALLIHMAPRAPRDASEAIASSPSPPAPPEEPSALEEAASAPAAGGWIQRPPRTPEPRPWRIADAQNDPELVVLTSNIGRRSFIAAARAAGLPVGEAYRAVAALRDVKNLDRCRPKDEFVALVARAGGKLKAFEYVVADDEIYQAREGEDGLLRGVRLDLKATRQRVLGMVRVDGSFEDSARAAGFEPGLTRVIDRALSGRVRSADFERGDVVRMVAQELLVLGEFSRWTGVEAIEYIPREGKPIRLYYVTAGDFSGYVDEQGRRFGRSRWASPIPGARVTSRFSKRRFHPVLRRYRPHNGIDFRAGVGTPVAAAAGGTVSYMGRAGPNGNLLKINHPGGYETGYSHLLRFAKGLRVGSRVSQRQVIALSGNTGRSTGPHLHFSVKRNGRFVDPDSLRLDELTRLPAADRALMASLRERYDALLESIPLPPPAPPEPAAAPLPIGPLPLEPQPGEPVLVPTSGEASEHEEDDGE